MNKSKNFTPIDFLINQTKKPSSFNPLNKESEPIKVSPEIEIEEVVEKEVEKPLQPYIQKRQETIKLPEEVKKFGVFPTGTPDIKDFQKVKLPISDEKIIWGTKQPVTTSIRWLATLALYILKIAHIQLRVVGGKVVRVLRR